MESLHGKNKLFFSHSFFALDQIPKINMPYVCEWISWGDWGVRIDTYILVSEEESDGGLISDEYAAPNEEDGIVSGESALILSKKLCMFDIRVDRVNFRLI